MNALFVGLGGAVGAVGRYGLSLLPCRSAFPMLTLLTNLIGAVLIGFVAGLAGRERLSSGWTLFWKTGVCGGFTTFSTFSNDGLSLLRGEFYGTFLLYALLSIGLGLVAVLAGGAIGKLLG